MAHNCNQTYQLQYYEYLILLDRTETWAAVKTG